MPRSSSCGRRRVEARHADPGLNIAGALLIAASILVVGRYEIGHISPGARGFTVYGVDTWTGAPFMRTATTD